MVNKYYCPRCGYGTDRMSSYKTHIQRKKSCSAVLSDVMPTLENVSNNMNHVSNTATHATVNNAPIEGDHNRVTNTVHVTNNNNVTIVLNNSATPRPIDNEDLSYISPDMWATLGRLAGKDPETAVKVLVHLVNFNPMQPQNMNTYVPSDLSQPAAVFHHASQGWKDWCLLDRKKAVEWLINGRSHDLQDYMGDSMDTSVRPADLEAFEEFFDADTPQDLVAHIMNMAVNNGVYMDAAHLGPDKPVTRPYPFGPRALAKMQEEALQAGAQVNG